MSTKRVATPASGRATEVGAGRIPFRVTFSSHSGMLHSLQRPLQDDVARSDESGENVQHASGRSSPIWLELLLNLCVTRRKVKIPLVQGQPYLSFWLLATGRGGTTFKLSRRMADFFSSSSNLTCSRICRALANRSLALQDYETGCKLHRSIKP